MGATEGWPLGIALAAALVERRGEAAGRRIARRPRLGARRALVPLRGAPGLARPRAARGGDRLERRARRHPGGGRRPRAARGLRRSHRAGGNARPLRRRLGGVRLSPAAARVPGRAPRRGEARGRAKAPARRGRPGRGRVGRRDRRDRALARRRELGRGGRPRSSARAPSCSGPRRSCWTAGSPRCPSRCRSCRRSGCSWASSSGARASTSARSRPCARRWPGTARAGTPSTSGWPASSSPRRCSRPARSRRCSGWPTAGTARRPRAGHVAVAGVAWYKVLALTALGRRDEAERLAQPAAPGSEERRPVQVPRRPGGRCCVELPAGRAEAALADPHSTIRELERHDPHGRLAVSQALTGPRAPRHRGGRRGDGVVRAQPARIRASRPRVRRARRAVAARLRCSRSAGTWTAPQLELTRAGPPQGTGWRGVSSHTAEAFVAAGRGDAAAAVAAARRALRPRPAGPASATGSGPRWTSAAVLGEIGSHELAIRAIDEARSALDEQFPGELGHYHRARLLATRAWLDYDPAEPRGGLRRARRCWEEAGDNADQVVRAHWSPAQADPVAGARGPGDRAGRPWSRRWSAPFPGARRWSRSPTTPSRACGGRRCRRRSRRTTRRSSRDSPSSPTTPTSRSRRRPRRRASAWPLTPLPLRFALLGGFAVTRAGWEIADRSWKRPLDARLVRLLLVHGGRPVPEDVIFEALWPGRSARERSRRPPRGGLAGPGRGRSARGRTEPDRERRAGLPARASATGPPSTPRSSAPRRSSPSPSAATSGRRCCERARSLWTGEPLPEERYSDWAAAYRERLIDRYIAVLTALVELRERAGDPAGRRGPRPRAGRHRPPQRGRPPGADRRLRPRRAHGPRPAPVPGVPAGAGRGAGDRAGRGDLAAAGAGARGRARLGADKRPISARA